MKLNLASLVVGAVMAALALLDAGPLRGWGHPLSHCALLPGLYGARLRLRGDTGKRIPPARLALRQPRC